MANGAAPQETVIGFDASEVIGRGGAAAVSHAVEADIYRLTSWPELTAGKLAAKHLVVFGSTGLADSAKTFNALEAVERAASGVTLREGDWLELPPKAKVENLDTLTAASILFGFQTTPEDREAFAPTLTSVIDNKAAELKHNKHARDEHRAQLWGETAHWLAETRVLLGEDSFWAGLTTIADITSMSFRTSQDEIRDEMYTNVLNLVHDLQTAQHISGNYLEIMTAAMALRLVNAETVTVVPGEQIQIVDGPPRGPIKPHYNVDPHWRPPSGC